MYACMYTHMQKERDSCLMVIYVHLEKYNIFEKFDFAVNCLNIFWDLKKITKITSLRKLA